jgi:hypothetical protein
MGSEMSTYYAKFNRQAAERINAAAERLMSKPLSKQAEREHTERYVRNSIALDPDTPLAARRAKIS